MATVGFDESTRYALRLYAYVLATFVFGAVGVGLGAALLWPEIRAWRGPGEATVAPGAAGGLLLFLGISVLTIGWLATAYKLLADGVAAGGVLARDSSRDRDRQSTGQNSGESSATPDRGANGARQGSVRHDDRPPEPSPSDIAFGDDESPQDEGTLPGGEGGDDPLGERSK